VDEKGIYKDKKAAGDDEIDWLSGILAHFEKDNTFFLVTVADGRVIAFSDINRHRGYGNRVGAVGIVVK